VSEEVMMRQQRMSRTIIVTLAIIASFSLVACEKLSVKKLTANYHFNNANNLFRDGKFSKAIEAYEKVIKLNPDLKEAYRFVGECYKSLYVPGRETADNKDRAAKALDALKKAYEVDPDNKDVIYSLGDMYDRLRDLDNAEQMYLKIIELEPGNMNNYYVVAEFYKRYAGEKKELKDKAEQMYLRRIETDPENVQGYAYMANYYDNLSPTEFKNKFDQALDYVKRRQALEPDSAEVYYTVGVNRFQKAYQLQNFLSQAEKEAVGAEAEKNLLKAIEIDPSFPDSYAYMKILYINVQAKLYPEKEARYTSEADRYGEKFQEARKRQLDRIKLEKELKKG
jgi:tetratricopeptide (TPR) repeat protein